jgi:hypothetical protein
MRRSDASFKTTSTTLMWWILAMVAFAEVQSRSQAGLDAVVAYVRLPIYADARRLPYVRAIINEVLRWRPAGRLGVPHVMAIDGWYDGIFNPKGVTCPANIWQIGIAIATGLYLVTMRMASRQKGILGTAVNSYQAGKKQVRKGHLSFGFGRGICVGKHLEKGLSSYTLRGSCVRRLLSAHRTRTGGNCDQIQMRLWM